MALTVPVSPLVVDVGSVESTIGLKDVGVSIGGTSCLCGSVQCNGVHGVVSGCSVRCCVNVRDVDETGGSKACVATLTKASASVDAAY